MNAGQMLDDVIRAVANRIPVGFYGRMGGIVPFPDEILDEIRKIAIHPPKIGADPQLAWMQQMKAILN